MTEKHFAKGALNANADGLVSFVASTASVDRMGDVIRQDGWQLKNYLSNPVVLWQHNHDQPIGRAHNVRVEDGALKADFEFAPAEVNPFADQVGKMVKAGFLKAVSVGFRALEAKPIKSGYEFVKSELLEISVVSVPANQDALAYAKSFMQDDDIARVFAGTKNIISREKEAVIRHRKNLIKWAM